MLQAEKRQRQIEAAERAKRAAAEAQRQLDLFRQQNNMAPSTTTPEGEANASGVASTADAQVLILPSHALRFVSRSVDAPVITLARTVLAWDTLQVQWMCGAQGGNDAHSALQVENSAERAGPSSFIEDEVSAANAAKLRQQQRAETIRCRGLSCARTHLGWTLLS